MADSQNKEPTIDPRKIQDLYNAFENADYTITNRYRYSLSSYPICEIPDGIKQIPVGDNYFIFRITKLVYNKNENVINKLTTVYHTLSQFDNTSIIMLLISDGDCVEIYGGIALREVHDGKCEKKSTEFSTLMNSLKSNFPGIEISDFYMDINNGKKRIFDKKELINRVIYRDGFISSVSGIASLRDEKETHNINYIQGMEKLIDTMKGTPFSALFVADSINTDNIESICADYEDIYSQLSPFLQSQQTVGKSDGISDTESFINGVTETTNKSITDSTSIGHSKGKYTANTIGGNIGADIKFVKIGGSYNYTVGKNEAENETKGQSVTMGSAKSLSEQNSVAKSFTESSNEGIQLTYQNRAVKELMSRIDEQIKRLRNCENYGIFDFGAYFIADDMPKADTAAATYESLMRGEGSSTEVSSICSWNSDESKLAGEYLKRLYHPLITIPDLTNKIDDNSYGIKTVTPTTMVSGKELAIHMGMPRKAINGVAILECAEFGRNVVTYDDKNENETSYDIGKIFHMNHPEKTRVSLAKNSLCSHTFITGSTGSGKSNTIYKMLQNARKDNVKFLVVEPAKGEYKNVFGVYNDVSVYGTNPYKTPLLQINPFSFPEDTHILEHLDRLVEIFNVCWPMYAAMPAVLKNAIEKSYEDCGWDLTKSSNKYGEKLYPNFADVSRNVRVIIDESEYDSDNKGAYKGSLLTRLNALTNGINGMIFTTNEISNEELFDENVIVDLSRVGSSETKSLIMGMLVLKLQEYRMSTVDMNAGLKHITVLEETHNILKRTSTEQSSESANLIGKSVEMISNAIAEMRTYGEGFIIADQAPGLLDMAAIRNTNTKIIMRLPDQADRELVGRSANLNDDQITELAKLPCGVAAVYQNEWVQPVLCKIDRFKQSDKLYSFIPDGNDNLFEEQKNVSDSLLDCIMNKELFRNGNTDDLNSLKGNIVKSKLDSKVKVDFMNYIVSEQDKSLENLRTLIYDFLSAEKSIENARHCGDINEWVRTVVNGFNPQINGYTNRQIDIALALVLYEQNIRDNSYEKVYHSFIEVYNDKGGVFW